MESVAYWNCAAATVKSSCASACAANSASAGFCSTAGEAAVSTGHHRQTTRLEKTHQVLEADVRGIAGGHGAKLHVEVRRQGRGGVALELALVAPAARVRSRRGGH